MGTVVRSMGVFSPALMRDGVVQPAFSLQRQGDATLTLVHCARDTPAQRTLRHIINIPTHLDPSPSQCNPPCGTPSSSQHVKSYSLADSLA